MALSPGTALQNGQYVIDALMETASNGDLYWGTHIVTGVPVYIQHFPPLPLTDRVNLSDWLGHYRALSASAQSPFPKSFQLFCESEFSLYGVLETVTGLPWSQLRTAHPPMTVKQALITLRQVAGGILWLTEQGVAGVDISPNRVWLSPQGDRVSLTGLPRLQSSPQSLAVVSDSTLTIRALSQLLGEFLLGHRLSSPQAEVLLPALRKQLPNLNPRLLQAIYQGMAEHWAGSATAAVSRWLALLPDHVEAAVTPPRPAQIRSIQSPSVLVHHRHRQVYPILAVTAIAAATGGVIFGTAWRLNASNLPGGIQFDPDQSFPAQTGWNGDNPEAAFETPYLPEQDSLTGRETWFETDWDTEILQEEPIPTSPIGSEDKNIEDAADGEIQEAVAPDASPLPIASPADSSDPLTDLDTTSGSPPAAAEAGSATAPLWESPTEVFSGKEKPETTDSGRSESITIPEAGRPPAAAATSES